MNNTNPFLQSKGIADNENKLNNNVKNPFIEAKKNQMRRNLTRKENQYCFTLMITKKSLPLVKPKVILFLDI